MKKRTTQLLLFAGLLALQPIAHADDLFAVQVERAETVSNGTIEHAVILIEGDKIVMIGEDLAIDSGIPVMGHLGLTPQSINAFGGYRIQGRGDDAADRILRDALALQDAGAYSIVLEGVPWPLAKRVTDAIEVPTIGIGAGVHCDGQVLVIYDLLGMDPGFKPTFVKAYDDLHSRIGDAVRSYRSDVREARFPTADHSFE